MRVALISDLHLVSPDDPFKEIHATRAHFALAWPSAKDICARVRAAAPDLVISLGDLVDWYSDENRDFAIDLLNDIGIPWVVTPGNHDFEAYARNPDGTVNGPSRAHEGEDSATRLWNARGIELGSRVVSAGDTGLVLLNSACSTVPEGTRAWLNQALNQHPHNYLFTHVPLDIPQIRELILTIEPGRNLRKYVQSGAPWVYPDCLKGRIQKAFFGHLHFGGKLNVDGTEMYFCGLSVAAVGRTYRDMGQAMILDVAARSEPKIILL